MYRGYTGFHCPAHAAACTPRVKVTEMRNPKNAQIHLTGYTGVRGPGSRTRACYGTLAGCVSIWYICVTLGSKDRTDRSVSRSRVRECGTSGHAAAH